MCGTQLQYHHLRRKCKYREPAWTTEKVKSWDVERCLSEWAYRPPITNFSSRDLTPFSWCPKGYYSPAQTQHRYTNKIKIKSLNIQKSTIKRIQSFFSKYTYLPQIHFLFTWRCLCCNQLAWSVIWVPCLFKDTTPSPACFLSVPLQKR